VLLAESSVSANSQYVSHYEPRYLKSVHPKRRDNLEDVGVDGKNIEMDLIEKGRADV
jgi:hypothetical protein